jgi:hypothetical protein
VVGSAPGLGAEPGLLGGAAVAALRRLGSARPVIAPARANAALAPIAGAKPLVQAWAAAAPPIAPQAP